MPTNDAVHIATEQLRDIRVAYRQRGAGARVVLIHGLAQDHRMWAAQQTGLAGYSTLAYDVRGHGGTTLGDADGTLSQLGEDLVALLERFGPAHCVGFSLGGTIAVWAAAERPDLVDSVVAVATSSVVGRRAAAAMQQRIDVVGSGDAAAARRLVREDTKVQLAKPTDALAEIVDGRMEAIGDGGGYVNGAHAMLWMAEHPLNETLARIALPVLVVTGARDVVCPPRAAEIMLEHLASAEYRELADVGHLVTDEDPDALTDVLRTWLDRQGRTGCG
ncbi:MAG: alpha/beta hydrolase [Solirubrobacteraceae bacterium]